MSDDQRLAGSSACCSSSRSSRRFRRSGSTSPCSTTRPGTSPAAGRTTRSPFLELLLIIANVGTAVVLYPIARRQNEALALGYVAARIVECVFIGAGIIFVLGVVSLRDDSPGAADLAVSLAALKDWTFLFGPGFIVPWGNGLILGYLMHRSGLVPRRMAWFGLIGGQPLLISSIGTLVDWWGAGGTVPALLVIPEFIWEAFLGIYCAGWGFRRDAPILSGAHSPAEQPA